MHHNLPIRIACVSIVTLVLGGSLVTTYSLVHGPELNGRPVSKIDDRTMASIREAADCGPESELIIILAYDPDCGACGDATARAAELKEAFSSRGVDVVDLPVGGTESQGGELPGRRAGIPLQGDDTTQLSERLSIVSIPTMLIVSGQGKILARRPGPRTFESDSVLVHAILAEAGNAGHRQGR
jgi:hypothetical protein